MRKTVPIFCALFAAAFLLGATEATTSPVQKKKTAAAKTASKSAAQKPAAKTPTQSATKAPARKGTSKQTTAVARRRPVQKPPVQSWRTTQRTPTPDRYKEIQQALASKGYLEESAPNGSWDTSSISALKKFQEDENLEPSGKIDSLSLIALGLGPKHEQQ